MAITIANIQTAGDYYRRSTETNELTAAKALEAAALAVEDVHSQALFRFTKRRQTFDYLDGQTDYLISDNATNFEAPVRAPDFRAVRDLRLVGGGNNDFDYVDPNDFHLYVEAATLQKVYTVDQHDGGNVLMVNQPDLGESTTIHQANDHDANGTWTADTTNSDALNVRTDDKNYKTNSGSVAFDADVSQSGNNKVTIYNSDMTAVDLSDYANNGVIRMWVYVPDVTDDTSIYVTSVELRWGSSDSAYWSKTVAKPVDNLMFQDRWNLVEFAWKDATETGTVDETAIDYLLVTINYGASQADDAGFRINDIQIYNPKEMELEYFSNFTVKVTSTGILKARATATSDELLCPDIYKQVYVDAYNLQIANILYPSDSPIVAKYELKYRGTYNRQTKKWVGGSLEQLVREQGERLKMPQRKLKPQLSW